MKNPVNSKLSKAIALCVAGSALSFGASAAEHMWVKSGQTLAAAESDRASCTQRAVNDVARIDYASPAGQSKFNRENNFRSDKERAELLRIDSCMIKLGYLRKRMGTSSENGVAAVAGSLHY